MPYVIKNFPVLIAACLAGCSNAAGAPPSKIVPPSARYMTPLRSLPKTPRGIEANGIGERHLAELRGVCVARGRTIRGLQNYARVVSSKKQ